MTLSRFSTLLVLLAATTAAAQDSLPIRSIADPVARSPVPLHSVAGLRELSDGRVLVGDNVDRRLLLFDRALTASTTVLDGNDGKLSGWQAPGTLIGYHADSTLILLGTDLTLQLITPTGGLGRPIAFPVPGDATKVLPADGQPVIDREGRLIYRGTLPMIGALGRDRVDSAPLVRVQFSTRHIDTLAFVKVRGERVNRAPPGTNPPVLVTINPLAPIDDWVVLDDGTVEIIRAADYHIDWISPDGIRKSTPPVPARPIPVPHANLIAVLTRMQDSLQTSPAYRVEFNLDSLPSVVPAFRGNSAKLDLSGNTWVLRFHPEAPTAGPQYDVINRGGTLVDRIQLPAGTTLAGFGASGMYVAASAGGVMHIERFVLRVGSR